MSAVPGWYPDPAQPDRLRLWDGNGWTTQTSGPIVLDSAASGLRHPYTAVLPRTTPHRPPPRRPAGPGPAAWMSVLAAVVAIALAVGAVVLVSGGHSRKPSASATGPRLSTPTATVPGCPNPLPPGASATAAAYVHALNMAAPGWAAVSEKLARENRYTHLSDLAPQIAADGTFLTYLRKIQFPAADLATATRLIKNVTAYRALLAAEERDWPLFDQQASQRQQVTDARSAASSQLRSLLGLPQATCGYWRP